MPKIYSVEYEYKTSQSDGEWWENSVTVAAGDDAQKAIDKVMKWADKEHSLSEDEGGNPITVKVEGLRLRGVSVTTDVDVV